MKKHLLAAPAAALALALAGCGPAAPPANVAANESAVADESGEGNALARVLAMNDGARNMTFARALIDARLPCDNVIKSERLPDQDGRPQWRADCRSGDAYMIGITPDGTVNIISRGDR